MEKSMSLPKKGLGRGLSALIPGASEPRIETDSEAVSFRVEVDRITPSPFQPRRMFDEAKIEELASSIRNQGIIQPLVVRRNGDGYELIAGERRWRAAMRAGLTHVPIVVRDASDHEALQLALVENLQREDLNPIEEANGYRRLLDEEKVFLVPGSAMSMSDRLLRFGLGRRDFVDGLERLGSFFDRHVVR